MGDPNSDRVTNKQLYDELAKHPNRRELYLVLVAGQTAASLVTAYVTSLSPPQQAAAIGRFVFSLFS